MVGGLGILFSSSSTSSSSSSSHDDDDDNGASRLVRRYPSLGAATPSFAVQHPPPPTHWHALRWALLFGCPILHPSVMWRRRRSAEEEEEGAAENFAYDPAACPAEYVCMCVCVCQRVRE